MENNALFEECVDVKLVNDDEGISQDHHEQEMHPQVKQNDKHVTSSGDSYTGTTKRRNHHHHRSSRKIETVIHRPPPPPEKVPEPAFIIVKPLPVPKPRIDENYYFTPSENNYDTSFENKKKANQLPKELDTTTDYLAEPFPNLYPEFKYKFECRKGKPIGRHQVIDSSTIKSKTDKIGNEIGQQEKTISGEISNATEHLDEKQSLFEESEDGHGSPRLTLDISVEPPVIRRCTSDEALKLSRSPSPSIIPWSQCEPLKIIGSIDDLKKKPLTFNNIIKIGLDITCNNYNFPEPKIAWAEPLIIPSKLQAQAEKDESNDNYHEDLDSESHVTRYDTQENQSNSNSDSEEEEDCLSGDPDKELHVVSKTIQAKVSAMNNEEENFSEDKQKEKKSNEKEDDENSCFSYKIKNSDELLLLFGVKGPMVKPNKNDEDDSKDGELSKFYSIGEDDKGKVKYIVNKIKVAEHLKEFILMPVQIGFILQCSVVRDKKGVDRGLFPTYFLHLECAEGKRIFLMSARKRKKSKTSNYMISVDPCLLNKDKDESMVGKVRSNLLGTQYSIYDGGKSPKSATFMESADDYREQLGAVLYEYNLLGFRGPRKLKVLIPSMLNEYQRYAHRPEDDSDNLIERNKTDVIGGILELKNKSPAWHEENQSYVLNFHGRVSKPSVKNFQLVHEDNEDYTILQFGRIKQDEFTLDFRFPLCPLQAFAIALTSFDNKLACE